MDSSEEERGKQLLEIFLGIESRGEGHFTFQSINYVEDSYIVYEHMVISPKGSLLNCLFIY